MFTFLDLNSGVTKSVFLKILRTCVTSISGKGKTLMTASQVKTKAHIYDSGILFVRL